MINLFYIVIFAAISLPFAKHAICMFQQNRYEFYRYTKWLFNRKNIHFSYILIYVLLMMINLFVKIDFLTIVLTVIFAMIMIQFEAKKSYIKPLVYTARVKRQIACFAVVELLVLLGLCMSPLAKPLVGILAVYLPYLLVYLMAIITLPIENAIKKKYENEARSILNKMTSMQKIGITGSYGKTSTKNIVHDILNETYYTLMTPASYNTPMGITRTVREYMKPIHEVFVCEMGADRVGEITYLMDFVKPKYGIVTSIGPQHLNTFHSLDNIIFEKMQMIEKLPSDGVGILNIDNEYIRDYKIKNNCKTVSVGIQNTSADYVAKNIEYDVYGSHFTVSVFGKDYEFETCLLGEHNIMNILVSVALAYEMGISIEEIQKSVKKVKRITHRLELKKINGFTFIDNAFNSNPVGCKLSLDVLSRMPNKRVIVTPGLIDLGAKEYDYNKEFGAYMKGRADFVILVGKKQTQAIYDGLMESGFEEANILVKDHVKEAFAYIYQNLSKDDTILLENDLPDAFSV